MMIDDRFYCNSSAIRMVEYWEGYLKIYFRDGTDIRYSRVPERVYKDFAGASSKGCFYNKYIRGKYDCNNFAGGGSVYKISQPVKRAEPRGSFGEHKRYILRKMRAEQ